MEDRGFELRRRLDEREERGCRRAISPVDRIAERAYTAPPPGGSLPVLGSEEAIVFASNNYLGLTADRRVQDAARRAAMGVGTGAGASRTVAGDTLVHHDLERRLAETTGTDRVLAFSSGYAANVGTIAALAPDVIFADEWNHESLVDGCRLSDAAVETYGHCDVASLRAKLRARADRSESADESWLVVTDTVFGADGRIAPLEGICDAAAEFGAWVMVDEAHAVGLYADGGGIVQSESLADRVHVQMGALSKALASQGGYVAGSDALIEYLINDARSFVFSTGLAPTAAAAATEALHVSRHGDPRERLWENVAHLRDGLETLGFAVLGDTQLLPVLVDDRRDAQALETGLRERSIVASTTPSAVPDGTSHVRVVPVATHDEADIVACLEAFKAAGEDVGVI